MFFGHFWSRLRVLFLVLQFNLFRNLVKNSAFNKLRILLNRCLTKNSTFNNLRFVLNLNLNFLFFLLIWDFRLSIDFNLNFFSLISDFFIMDWNDIIDLNFLNIWHQMLLTFNFCLYFFFLILLFDLYINTLNRSSLDRTRFVLLWNNWQLLRLDLFGFKLQRFAAWSISNSLNLFKFCDGFALVRNCYPMRSEISGESWSKFFLDLFHGIRAFWEQKILPFVSNFDREHYSYNVFIIWYIFMSFLISYCYIPVGLCYSTYFSQK